MSEEADIRDLARVILHERKQPRAILLSGEVGGTGGSRVDVYISGDTVLTQDLRYLASYTPTVGDIVWMLKAGPAVLVLGKLA